MMLYIVDQGTQRPAVYFRLIVMGIVRICHLGYPGIVFIDQVTSTLYPPYKVCVINISIAVAGKLRHREMKKLAWDLNPGLTLKLTF
jgi:hypothetical protein